MDQSGRDQPGPQPYEWPASPERRAQPGNRGKPGKRGWRPRLTLIVAAVACVVVVALLLYQGGALGKAARIAAPVRTAISQKIAATPTTVPFDPSIGAPLPTHRIVAAYGIVGGGPSNGPASTLDMLDGWLPQLQQLGDQYAALDATHPVMLGIDLVVNVIQPCDAFPQWCASWADDATIQAYIAYCQQHHLLLFFDLQLGTEPVADAVTNHLLPYLQQYPFTELALDTEFHFPNTPQGYADAAGYPCCLGWIEASEVNWAVGELARISEEHHQPRKVLIIHQWSPLVIHDKDQIQRNPNVSLVLQSDGWGGAENKLGDYQIFVQQELMEYGGYKLFMPHDGDAQFDIPLQSPDDVMHLFPQPLFVSYQ